MELHVCSNCELINEVVNEKVKRFDILTEENIALHSALMKTRDSIVELETELLQLHNAVTTERERNLQMYMQQICYDPQTITNLMSSSNSKNKMISSSASCTKNKSLDYNHLPDKDYHSLQYNKLLQLYQEQEKVYEDNLNTLKDSHNKTIFKLKEQLNKAHNHIITILEMYAMYRQELFQQKKDNIKDQKMFLETLDTIYKENNKHMQNIEKKTIETTTNSINNQIKRLLNSFSLQLEKRDKLVTILRRQQTSLESSIEELKKEGQSEHESYKTTTNELRKQLKREKQKHIESERRRLLDGEGFRNDIAEIRKSLVKLRKNALFINNEKHMRDCEKYIEVIQQMDKKLEKTY